MCTEVNPDYAALPLSDQKFGVEIPEEELEKLADELKPLALAYAEDHQLPEYLKNELREARTIDALIAPFVVEVEGQIHMLKLVQTHQPDIAWYRGGHRRQWGQGLGLGKKHFSDQDNETFVLDMSYGVFGRPALALAHANLSHAHDPVLYSLSIDDLMKGLQMKAIKIAGGRGYDTQIHPLDNSKYVAFCREYLRIQELA